MNQSRLIKGLLLTVIIFGSTLFNSLKAQISTFPWVEDFGNAACGLPTGFTNLGTDPWDFQNTSESYMEGTDHTTGSGCFASMDDSGSAVDDTCVLISPAFDLSALPAPALSFFWQNSNSTTSIPHTAGPRPWSNLEVDVSTDSGKTWAMNVLQILDSQQIGWVEANIDLTPYKSTETMIRFRGLETQSFYSDLSLDDIGISNLFQRDAELTSIDGLDGLCPGTASVSATFKNAGALTLTSLVLNWSVNGVVQTPANYSGSLGYQAFDTQVLGSFATVANTTYDVVVWSTAPNAGVDGNTSNDTLSVLSLQTGYSGNLTVGPTGDFTSIVAAANAISTYGVCGPLTIDVANGIYPGHVTFTNVVGTSSTNTIVFNGNGATITDTTTTTDRYMVLLDNSQYITLDSFNIVGTGVTYGIGVQLMNSADYNTISNCYIDLSAVTSTSSVNSTGILASGSLTSTSTAGNNANYCTFLDNTINGGTDGGMYYGIRINGNSGGLDCVGNTIENNTIMNAYAYNIYLDDTEGAQVINNDVSRATKTSVTSFYGVYITGGFDNLIDRNKFHNTHDAASSVTGAIYGLYFSSADAPVGFQNIASNNIFYNINNSGTIYAIYNIGSDGAHYFHNTFSLDNASATGGTIRGVYQTTAASDIEIVNNIFSITQGGSGVKHGLYFNTNTSVINCDNNIIYMNSTGSGAQYTGRWDAIDYGNMPAWQTANTNAFDQSSDSLDPVFLNPSSDNYVPSTVTGNNIGAAGTGVSVDLAGNPRSLTTPDPGAYEFVGIHANDSCHNATVITAGIVGGTTVNANSDNEVSCVVGNDLSGGIWFKYRSAGDFVTVSLCNSSFDTRIRVFEGSCGSLTCVTGNEDACGAQSIAEWCSKDTTDYYILVYGNGQEGKFEMELTEVPVTTPTISAMNTNFCSGDSAVLTSTTAASYIWNNVGASTAQMISVFISDSINVTTTDTNGCSRTSAVEVITANPLPLVDLGADTSICDNGSLVLDAGNGVSYLWSTSETSQTITYDGSTGNGTVSVEITDTNSCVGSDEIVINVNAAPVVNLGADTTICNDASITLDAGPGASYNWSIGGTGQTITFDGSTGTSTISVDVTDANGCTGTDEITIEVETCIGIETFADNNQISLFPNPNSGIVTLSFENNSASRISLKVYDIQGKSVFVEEFYMNNSNRKQLNLEELPKGFYTIVVQGAETVQTAKMIIQ